MEFLLGVPKPFHFYGISNIFMGEKSNFPEVWGLGLGLFLALYAGFLNHITPKEPALDNHSGFESTLLGLEMAETPKQVQDLVGIPDTIDFFHLSAEYRKVHYFDFGFIFCYLAFLTYTGHYAGRKVRPIFLKIFMGMVLLLVIAGFADLIENILILNVLDAKTAEEMTPSLEYLKPTSQLKWFCLFGYVAIVSVYFWLYEKGWILRTASILFFTGFFLQLFSIYKTNILELSFPFFALGLTCSWFHYGFSLAFSSLSKKT
ncbi:hypothetical protein [Leptospira meyeri]|uniref:hypothetical protein n=1 Tax=Leptospira meyeri TaxID=29508 RepID=UPI000C2AF6CA|nr:hypothetical protein [Leptospira meyeri]PJZ79486.1 hypothetical protein CH359_17930 [Leptospira meyeri]PJZ98606.1 hypothetical protein CH358_06775 [Leptospira meyeri]